MIPPPNLGFTGHLDFQELSVSAQMFSG